MELPELVAEVESRAREIYEGTLDPIADRFEFEASPPQSETSGLPMVLLLGNHSSGKSSYINFLAGKEIQRTGIAPIDDGFTIITYGAQDDVLDGDAATTNPLLEWGELKRFGQQLTSHLKLRLVNAPSLEGLALIDSPGMIDAADSDVDRGYDFNAVVRWFAERADVILLLFDPDKPGTTGETLQVLTGSLAGLDHKLLLIFNKVDRFESMRDYARAYGALCWNLSKALARKDLPHIYNTYLPAENRTQAADHLPLDDFDYQREEVRHEVRRAPYRRVDNVVSRLYQYARRLSMHVKVLDQMARERAQIARRYYFLGALVMALGGGGGYLGYTVGQAQGEIGLQLAGAAGLLTLILLGVLGFLWYFDNRRGEELPLETMFQRTYHRELTLADESDDLNALWAMVGPRLGRSLATGKVFPTVRRAELKKLNKVIQTDIPELRARISEGRQKLTRAPSAVPPPPVKPRTQRQPRPASAADAPDAADAAAEAKAQS